MCLDSRKSGKSSYWTGKIMKDLYTIFFFKYAIRYYLSGKQINTIFSILSILCHGKIWLGSTLKYKTQYTFEHDSEWEKKLRFFVITGLQ